MQISYVKHESIINYLNYLYKYNIWETILQPMKRHDYHIINIKYIEGALSQRVPIIITHDSIPKQKR
jgi:hypothetical protein